MDSIFKIMSNFTLFRGIKVFRRTISGMDRTKIFLFIGLIGF